jgi:hypothetical protein
MRREVTNVAQRTVWLDVVERLNQSLGTYEVRIKRELVDVALARAQAPANGNGNGQTQKAYAYRVELSKDGVMASAAGLDQPEVLLPQLCLRLLSHAGVEQVTPQQRSQGYEAFAAALEATRLERGIEDNVPQHGAEEDETNGE